LLPCSGAPSPALTFPSFPHSPRTLPCPHIPLADLIRATNGWAEGRRVGGGRWSDVYRGEWGEWGESGRRAEGGKSEERSEAESDGGNGRGGEGKQDGGEGKQEGGEEGGALQRKQGMRAGRGRARGRGGVWAVKRMRGGPPWESLEAHALALARVGHPNVLRLVGWCSWQAGGGIEGLPEAGQRGVREGGGEGGMQEGRARGEERGGQERGAKGGGKERGEEGSRQEEGEEKGGQEGGEEGQVLVYEWMERGSLQAVLQAAAQAGSSPLSLRQRVGITVGVLRALKAVQSHGQVHGDLKPSNVLLTVAWEARVGDWSAVRMGQRVHVDMGGHQEGSWTSGSGEGGGSKGGSSGEAGGSGSAGSSGKSGHSGSSSESKRSGSSTSSSSSGSGGLKQRRVLRCTEGHVDPAVLHSDIASAMSDMFSVGVLLQQLLISSLLPHPFALPLPLFLRSVLASVGVLLLQLLTGWDAPYKHVDGQRVHISDWAQQHVTAGNVSPLLDPLLPHPPPPHSLLLPLFLLALSCTSPSPSSRPTPSAALRTLKPLRASLLQGERTGERLDSREGDSGERREGGGQSIGRWSGLFWGSGTGIWDGQGSGGALGTRLAMLGSEDSREFVV
ncbi:unnamed protein product, partial [Closterium sp. NIES-64]